MPLDNALAPAVLESGALMMSPLLTWQSAGVSMALDAQQLQWKLLLNWQDAVGSMQRDWWDGWIARYGGGVPIDV